MIKHIVMWRLKDHAEGADKSENAQKMKALLDACANVVPGMHAFEVELAITIDLEKNQLALEVACYHLGLGSSDGSDMSVCILVVSALQALGSIPEITFHFKLNDSLLPATTPRFCNPKRRGVRRRPPHPLCRPHA